MRTKLFYEVYKHARTVLEDIVQHKEKILACNSVEMQLGKSHLKPPFWWTYFSEQSLFTVFVLVNVIQAKLLFNMLYNIYFNN